jgi:hypothetical protein
MVGAGFTTMIDYERAYKKLMRYIVGDLCDKDCPECEMKRKYIQALDSRVMPSVESVCHRCFKPFEAQSPDIEYCPICSNRVVLDDKYVKVIPFQRGRVWVCVGKRSKRRLGVIRYNEKRGEYCYYSGRSYYSPETLSSISALLTLLTENRSLND